MLDKIERIEKPVEDNTDIKIVLEPNVVSGNDVLTVSNLAKSYPPVTLFSDISFEIKRGERVALIGNNGTGKTTILKIINNLIPADGGTVTLGSNVHIGYYDQEHQLLHMEKTIFEEISDAYPGLNNTKIRNVLAAFLFTNDDVFKRISDLSGGERGRVSLAKLMLSDANFLILDEPTNDLDIQTLTILEDYLDTFAGIVITVSHDRYFLDRIVNRIFAFEEGGHLKQYEGGYTDYLEKVKPIAKQEKSKPEKKENNGKKFQKEHQKKLKFTYKEQKEFETIDDDIAKLEEKIEQLDEEIMENATNSGKLAELTQQKEETEEALNEKMDRWVYLNDLAEQIANQ